MINKKNGKSLLGGKGANLAGMSEMGLSVPPGFTITTEVCGAFHKAGKVLPEGIWSQILSNLRKVEDITGKKLGDPTDPLLVSVRSGAAISMPGN
jgi:pyruvate,orthophosphate dikinase